jgi:hypothetical protein
LLPSPVDESAGEDDIDAEPDAGRLVVAASDGATEEEAAGPEPVRVAPEGAEAEE